jgi:hypothetical protein
MDVFRGECEVSLEVKASTNKLVCNANNLGR